MASAGLATQGNDALDMRSQVADDLRWSIYIGMGIYVALMNWGGSSKDPIPGLDVLGM